MFQINVDSTNIVLGCEVLETARERSKQQHKDFREQIRSESHLHCRSPTQGT